MSDVESDVVTDSEPGAALAPTATAVLMHVVRSIVDDPEAVRVDASEGRGKVRREVRVGPGDLGRVIGRGGRVANAIRTLAKAAAVREQRRVLVDILD